MFRFDVWENVLQLLNNNYGAFIKDENPLSHIFLLFAWFLSIFP